jgi:hypothetical protein
VRSGPGATRTILLFHIISARPSKQPVIVRTFLQVYMELGFFGSYFLFLQEQMSCTVCIVWIAGGNSAIIPGSTVVHLADSLQGLPDAHAIVKYSSTKTKGHMLEINKSVINFARRKSCGKLRVMKK